MREEAFCLIRRKDRKRSMFEDLVHRHGHRASSFGPCTQRQHAGPGKIPLGSSRLPCAAQHGRQGNRAAFPTKERDSPDGKVSHSLRRKGVAVLWKETV